jgi:hypothetical protein
MALLGPVAKINKEVLLLFKEVVNLLYPIKKGFTRTFLHTLVQKSQQTSLLFFLKCSDPDQIPGIHKSCNLY